MGSFHSRRIAACLVAACLHPAKAIDTPKWLRSENCAPWWQEKHAPGPGDPPWPKTLPDHPEYSLGEDGIPVWSYPDDRTCPYGTKSAFFASDYTIQTTGNTFWDYVAMFYSNIPDVLMLGGLAMFIIMYGVGCYFAIRQRKQKLHNKNFAAEAWFYSWRYFLYFFWVTGIVMMLGMSLFKKAFDQKRPQPSLTPEQQMLPVEKRIDILLNKHGTCMTS